MFMMVNYMGVDKSKPILVWLMLCIYWHPIWPFINNCKVTIRLTSIPVESEVLFSLQQNLSVWRSRHMIFQDCLNGDIIRYYGKIGDSELRSHFKFILHNDKQKGIAL